MDCPNLGQQEPSQLSLRDLLKISFTQTGAIKDLTLEQLVAEREARAARGELYKRAREEAARTGEDISSLAKRFGVPVEELQENVSGVVGPKKTVICHRCRTENLVPNPPKAGGRYLCHFCDESLYIRPKRERLREIFESFRRLDIRRLRILMIVYCLAIALACVYVPWQAELRRESRYGRMSIGYYPIWSEPDNSSPWYVSIDFKLILLEIAALTAIFGATGLILTFKERGQE